MNWLIDFDDTLANGPITYALQQVFPRLIQQHGLAYNAEHFAAVVLQCQEIASQTGNDARILQDLFQAMNWPQELQGQLLQEVFDNYKPILFADSVPFLERLTQAGQTLYILSNNNHAGDLATQMNLAPYFQDVFTPKGCGVKQGKPHPDIWEIIQQKGVLADVKNITIVGDDPWSEGLFSERCGLSCWIVDRLTRFEGLHASKAYQWARTLDEIGV
jgi:FMN phosphatase YigB (HAD superfamily)